MSGEYEIPIDEVAEVLAAVYHAKTSAQRHKCCAAVVLFSGRWIKELEAKPDDDPFWRVFKERGRETLVKLSDIGFQVCTMQKTMRGMMKYAEPLVDELINIYAAARAARVEATKGEDDR